MAQFTMSEELKAVLSQIDELVARRETSKGLSLNEYQRQSMRTAGDATDPAWELSGYGLGIAGEAGEVADLIKKVNHHGHPITSETLERLKKELGDVLWYVQAIAFRSGYSLEEVAQTNLDKLKARYPEGFSREASINRTDSEGGHYAIPHRCPEDCPAGTRL